MAVYKVEFMQHSKRVVSITYFIHLILYGKIMFVVGTNHKKQRIWYVGKMQSFLYWK
jgi:hypothetical protein